MSWLSEEWKERLPADALNNILTMESSLEKLQKDLAQYSFKTESLEASHENTKKKLEEQLKEIKQLEREKLDFQSRMEEEISKSQNLIANVKKKEDQICDCNEEISQYKEKVEMLQNQVNKLENELDNLDVKYGIDSQQAKEGNSKLSEAYEISKQRVEELKMRLEKERAEKRDQEICYENKIEILLQEEIRLQETNENLNKKISSLQLQNQAIDTEKLDIEGQLEELQNGISQIEKQEKQYENDNNLENIIKNKDQEINELKFKLSTNDQEYIGNYLGINMRKICSDSQIGAIDQARTPHSIILQNKALHNENDRLNKLLKGTTNQFVTYREKNNTVKQTLQINANENVDSGVALRGDSIAYQETELDKEEVLMSRVEKINSQDPLVYANTQTNDIEMSVTSDGLHHDCTDQFQHGINCVQLSDDLFESKAVLNSYKNENIKIKQELHQMKEIYEHHMRVCASQALSKKSSEKLTTQSDLDLLVVELQKKLLKEENSKNEILNTLKEKESQFIVLEKRLGSNDNVSATAVSKLEDLVDVILQQKYSVSSVKTENLSTDLEQFMTQLTNSFLSLHDDLVEGHQATRESIKLSTEEILQKLPTRFVKERERKNSESYREFSVNKHTRYRQVTGNGGIDDLENIKERIGNVQQTIYEYSCEIKRIEDERDHLQEELIKMVDLMKKKDEEYGHLSCLYETEKRKVDENDTCYRQEMNELKREQLAIYQEYREMCDNIKKKEIELLNRTKQNKLLTAEWREKEDTMNENISKLQQENTHITDTKSALQKQLDEKSEECDILVSRLSNSEDQLRNIFNNLSRVEDVFYKAKAKGLYK